MPPLQVDDRGEGTPLLWIHGFPLSSRIFQQQMSISGVRHLVPDLPGFGNSVAQDIESIGDYADMLLDLLDSKSIRKVVVAGVSMGGYIALSLLRKRPGIALGLVLIDTRETPDSEEGRANRYAQVERVGKDGTTFLIDSMLPMMLTSSTVQSNDQRLRIVRQAMESASARGVQSALRAMATRPDSSDVLRSAKCPTLVVVGTRDTLTPPSDAQRMAGLSANSTLVEIPDAAHLSNVEQPTPFNKSLVAFLETLR